MSIIQKRLFHTFPKMHLAGRSIIRDEENTQNNSGRRALSRKVMRVGYYWPHALKYKEDLVRKCAKCQLYAPMHHCLLKELTSISSPWPFAQWEVDVVGPMPPGKRGEKFVMVAIDFFTKWVEAEALVTITTKNITKFL